MNVPGNTFIPAHANRGQQSQNTHSQQPNAQRGRPDAPQSQNNFNPMTKGQNYQANTQTQPQMYAQQHPMAPSHAASRHTSSGANLNYYPTNYGSPFDGGIKSPELTFNMNSNMMNSSAAVNDGFFANEISWKEAFGSGSLPGEPPLLVELGINLDHILYKSLAVLNPFKNIPASIMDDADLAGPFLYCILFPIFLLFSGKVHFSAIYGVALFGWSAIWVLMNSMYSPNTLDASAGYRDHSGSQSQSRGIDGSRTASVLGYCMLPMLFLAATSMFLRLNSILGYVLGLCSTLWCTTSASTMFVAVLAMRNQYCLVAYPIFLFYSAFALMTLF